MRVKAKRYRMINQQIGAEQALLEGGRSEHGGKSRRVDEEAQIDDQSRRYHDAGPAPSTCYLCLERPPPSR